MSFSLVFLEVFERGFLKKISVSCHSMIAYWHRLATLDDDSLLQKAYNEILTIPDEVSDWKNTIKYILKLLGLESLFDCSSAISTTQVKR